MLEKRLQAIADKKIELRNSIESNEIEDLAAVEAEIDGLIAEETEVRNKLSMSKKLEVTNESLVLNSGGEIMEEKRTFGVDTVEYRDAYFKNLAGMKLTQEERAGLTSAADSGGAAIPTTTLNQIIEKLEQNAVIYNLISVSNIPGNLTFAVADATTDAAFKAEGTDGTIKDDTVKSVTLNGHELIKLAQMSAKLEAMSISALETYVVNEIARKMMLAIEKAIISGTGTNEPTGLLKAGVITQTADFTKAGMTYTDLLAIISNLGTPYNNNAVFVMPRGVFFSDILGMQDSQKRPIVCQDVQSPAKFNILGYPVYLNDMMPADTIIFGDFSYYRLNFSAPITLASDTSVGFLSGRVTYRGLAVVDGTCVLPDAFVASKRKAA